MEALREFMLSAGMERAGGGFGLALDSLTEAIRTAPSTRPGRYTVLDEVDLSERAVTRILEEVIVR
jgi:glycerol-1-phosphate dehydrogenase [NAD(P)+]